MKKSSNSGGQTLGASSCPSDRNTGGEGSREAILSAAEKRKMQVKLFTTRIFECYEA
jgi:hypothetical protein